MPSTDPPPASSPAPIPSTASPPPSLPPAALPSSSQPTPAPSTSVPKPAKSETSSRAPSVAASTSTAPLPGLNGREHAEGRTQQQQQSRPPSSRFARTRHSTGVRQPNGKEGMDSMMAKGSTGEDEPRKLVLEKFTLYETKSRFYIIGSCQSDARYRILKIDRLASPDEGLNVIEEAEGVVYTKSEIRELLQMIEDGNRNSGGLVKVLPVFYGIVGFIRFTAAYYMVLVKQRAAVALVGGHYIYHCEETIMMPVSPTAKAERTGDEAKLLSAFQQVDLSKNFYFSYTYDLTHTLQNNLTPPTPSPSSPPLGRKSASSTAPGVSPTGEGPTLAWGFNDKFVWNSFLLRPAFGDGKQGPRSQWILPIVHGYVDQAKIVVFGRAVYVTLIARRSRYFAGARFLKRGVNDQGYVANDVETEQIVSEALTTPFFSPGSEGPGSNARNPRYTAYVQHRGSIPVHWSQDTTNMSPKPPIDLTIVDPYFSAAALHFDDLFARYGTPVIAINLIKSKERSPRESKLLGEYEQCIHYLNQFLPEAKRMKYIPFDIAAANKANFDVIGYLEELAEGVLETTQFFHSGPEPVRYLLEHDEDSPTYRSAPLLQSGVARTNCIDCLDRTNAAQFVIGKAALGHQLYALGITSQTNIPFDCDAIMLLTEMYHDHGDTIALQYGGSHLVNTMETYRKIGAWTSHSRDMIEGLKRYYSNSFVDADKQTAINLFLGVDAPEVIDALRPPQQRRSYQKWFTEAYVEPPPKPPITGDGLAEIAADETDFWVHYYRPRLYTSFDRHFSYRVNSTAKYTAIKPGGSLVDASPFKPRVAPHQVGGVRRWMSSKAGTKAAQKRVVSQVEAAARSATIGEKRTATSGIAAVVGALLDPQVKPVEMAEYDSYVHQFRVLSLSQDLTEADFNIYETHSGLSTMGAEGLSVDPEAERIYREYSSRFAS